MVEPARPLRSLPLKTLTTTWSRRTSPPAATSVVLADRDRLVLGEGLGQRRPAPHRRDDDEDSPSTASVSADLSAPRHGLVRPVDAGVEDAALLQRRAQRAVQAVLEVEVAAPGHDVGEQVAVERGVLVEQGVELQGVLGGHQLVEPDLARRQVGPGARGQPVVGVGPADAHPLEDHAGDHNDALVGTPLR